ncbi:uracil-DNA glycosylase [uncultured Gimesia sp.]|mgnify:CR=1 FL=1|uniref:uracil-DNA glycosylase n=1 Tax=uncultured Gimesia sp. TaxID=1678688 RepID=UPI0026052962|nr:uracil-DNA glycosylase [uncultured Gimesia sp.]
MNEKEANHRSQRAARQLIESWQRSGVTHLKRVVPVPQQPTQPTAARQPAINQPAINQPAINQPAAVHEPATATATATVSASAISAEPGTRELNHAVDQGELLQQSRVSANEVVEVINETDDPRKEMSVPRTTKSKLTKGDRQAELEIIAEQVSRCQKCPELASTRTQTVFGVGNPRAKIMFIGEAPGADEDKQGEPFVGRAGKLLDKIIEACQMKRSDIYIANILRCRPPGNRNPTDEEAANCRGFLDAQIEIVDPDYIVCWGSVSAKNLLHSELPIGKMRGRFYEYGRTKVLCTYHPSYLLRNPSAKKDVWEDMIFLFQDMGIELKAQK